MNVSELIAAMERFSPPQLAEPWDNTGLIVGDPDSMLRGPVLLCIDFSPQVLSEALELNAGALVCYHPPIFEPTRRFDSKTPRQRALLHAVQAGLAIYSPHTALDAAEGGVNDWLADGILAALDLDPSRNAREALIPGPVPRAPTHKFVTFVPTAPAKFEKCVEQVRIALSAAGAGGIGEYDMCSFAAPGTGTFRGSARTNPALGSAGILEFASETRLEMIVESRRLKDVVAALYASHPYEEPAFEIYSLTSPPMKSVGQGRFVRLAKPLKFETIHKAVRSFLGLRSVRVAGDGNRLVDRFGLCAGAGESLLAAAIDAGCHAFITGEMRHHQILHALDQGCGVVLAGHTHTERGYLPTLAARLNNVDAEFQATVSRADVNAWVDV